MDGVSGCCIIIYSVWGNIMDGVSGCVTILSTVSGIVL